MTMLHIPNQKILACLLLLFSLKIMAADKEVGQALLVMSKELNKNFPLQIDKETAIETSAVVGDTLVFKYKFTSDTTISDPRFNSKLYEQHLLTSLQGSTCSDSNVKALMQRGAKFNYLFVDRTGKKIIDFTLNSDKCGENVFMVSSLASGQELNAAQIKQIEEIAAEIAKHSNANKHLHLDDMTVSFNAITSGRNVRFENVLRVKNGLSKNEIMEWLVETQQEIIPQVCVQNTNNQAFDRGLSYTFSYSSIYGQKMGDILVDKITCKRLGY